VCVNERANDSEHARQWLSVSVDERACLKHQACVSVQSEN
jgi:hypothetical protein